MAAERPFNVVNLELELVAAAKEQGFSVSFREWDRIHDLIAVLPGPERVAGHLAWAAVESAVGALIALIPWTAAYSVLDDRGQLQFAWVTPILVVLFVFSVALSAISFWFDHTVKGEHARTAVHICEDMDAIVRPFRPSRPDAR